MRLRWDKAVKIMKEYPNSKIGEFTIIQRGNNFSIEIIRSFVDSSKVGSILKYQDSCLGSMSISSFKKLLEVLKEPN